MRIALYPYMHRNVPLLELPRLAADLGYEWIELSRDCEAVLVPAGHTVLLAKGTRAVITQSLGGSFTLHVPNYGGLVRVSGRDADAASDTKLAQQTKVSSAVTNAGVCTGVHPGSSVSVAPSSSEIHVPSLANAG